MRRIFAALNCSGALMIRILTLTAVTLAMFATAPAQSQSRRELAERLDLSELRIGELEARFLAGDPVLDQLLERLENLDYQVRQVTGQLEQMAHENRQLRQQVETLEMERAATLAAPIINPDTEDFMSDGLGEDEASIDGDPLMPASNDPHATERAAATGVLGANMAGSLEANMPVMEPGEAYESARSRLMEGDIEGAQIGFETFISGYDADARVSEAQYWLGETHFVRNNFADAADNYLASLNTEPNGAKAPDALIRLAASLHGMGRTDRACSTLSVFGRQFPNASQASRDRAAREAVRANCQ
jgi:tol-pal system protein YbgF